LRVSTIELTYFPIHPRRNCIQTTKVRSEVYLKQWSWWVSSVSKERSKRYDIPFSLNRPGEARSKQRENWFEINGGNKGRERKDKRTISPLASTSICWLRSPFAIAEVTAEI
jgi:hypothetical protein